MKNIVRFTVAGDTFDLPEPVGLAILEESCIDLQRDRFCLGSDVRIAVNRLRRMLRDLSQAIDEPATKIMFGVVRQEINVLGHFLIVDKDHDPWNVRGVTNSRLYGYILAVADGEFGWRTPGQDQPLRIEKSEMACLEKLVLAGGRDAERGTE